MELLKLKDVCSVNSGISPPKDKKIFENGTVPFYKTLDVGRIKTGNISDSELKVSQEFADSKRVFEPGTILFPKSGASTLLNHRVMIQKKGLVASTLAAIVPIKDLCLSKYLFYYLLTIDTKDFIPESFYPGMKISEISEIPIPVSSLQEQEKIVERLDKVFENIDKSQEQILNLKFLYSQMKDSFINKKLSNEKTQVLSRFSDIQYGYTPDKNSKEKIEVPILRITDMQNNKVDWENVPNVKVSQETFDKFYLKKGDILFARTGGTLGKSYLFNEDKKAIFASYLIRVTNTKSDFYAKFLKYFFESTEYWKQVNQGTIGAAQPFFNGKKLGNLKIPYSNKDEQKLIIKKLDKLTDLIEKLNDLNMLKKNKYSNFQKSILNKEFSYE